MPTTTRFCFPDDTVQFLADVRAHNTKQWFDEHRDRYETSYVAAAQAFVEAVRPRLQRLVPGMRAEPRILGSIFRINRDARFGTDSGPYKDYLDLWFWEGERTAALSGLSVRISPDFVSVGAGARRFTQDQQTRYRMIIGDEEGEDLDRIVRKLVGQGYSVGGETLVRTPAQYPVPEARAHLSRHTALFVNHELPVAAATSPDLISTLAGHWRRFLPLHGWLSAHVEAPSKWEASSWNRPS